MNIKGKLTIVIPSYNEEKYIGRTIKSIAEQSNIEGTRVIIADNKSTDRTRDIIQNLTELYKDILNIELIDGGSVSVGRNRGASIAKTKYILFIDSDAILMNKNQINDTLFDMYHKKLDILTCKTKSYGKNIRTKVIFSLFNPINKFFSIFVPFAVGTYFLTSRKKFIEYGMFDESLHHSEDYVLSKKYDPKKFHISNHYIGQDDRRFIKTGYFGMIKLVIRGFFNRNNIDFYKKNINYW